MHWILISLMQLFIKKLLIKLGYINNLLYICIVINQLKQYTL